MDPQHFECGTECLDCPAHTEREAFEESLAETLDEKCGGEWKNYGLKSLLQTVIDISEIAETDKRTWTIKTDRLVSILTDERRRIERIQRWNNRKSE